MRWALSAVLAVIVAVSGTYAQNGEPVEHRIEIRPSFVVLVQLPQAYRTVYVGDPEIADVGAARTNTQVALHGRKIGSTNLIALDEQERVVFTATIIVGGGRQLGRMQIHNRSSLNAYTPYQCSSTGCRRVDDPLAEPLDPAWRTTVDPTTGTITTIRNPPR